MPFNLHSKIYQNLDFHLHREKIVFSESAALYLTNTIRVLAVSLVGIFLPIYIYNISKSYLFFNQDIVINGISWVIAYFLLRSIFTLVSLLFLGNLIFSKIHFQLSMIISFVFLVTEILLWYLSAGNLFLILIAGVLAGFKVTLYWVPYHIFFLRKSGRKIKSFGKNTSTRFFLTRIISSIGPAIGGLIIINFGFNVLFMTSILLLVVSALPIALVIHDWKHREHNMVKVIRKYVLNSKYKRIAISYIGEGVDSLIYVIFWPILLYLVINNFAKIGFINSLSFLLSSIAILQIGRLIDKHGAYKIHGIGVIINSLLYIPRMFFRVPALFYSLDVADKFVTGMYSLPIMSTTYEKARKLGGSDYILFREVCIHVGAIAALALILVVIQLTSTWVWVFGLAMIGSIMTFFIETDEN